MFKYVIHSNPFRLLIQFILNIHGESITRKSNLLGRFMDGVRG